jgi:dipeptidase D
MKNVFEGLQPEKLWHYFGEICQIPRLSKEEDRIAEYLMAFAKTRNLDHKTDEIGNVLIKKKAYQGKENVPSVILQSHMDMVGEKNKDIVHDFSRDPIKPYIEGAWVKAEGTTLGADDGIGIAAQLALLDSEDISHGPIECLFTRDEESGLTGAFALSADFFDSSILINLDSEDWGEIFIGCAGGRDTNAEFSVLWEKAPSHSLACAIAVKGLQGGHSGDEIHKGHGNSIKILNRILFDLATITSIRLASVEGGNARNAIPREAFATLVFPEKDMQKVMDRIASLEKIIRNELCVTAPDLSIRAQKIHALPKQVMGIELQKKLFWTLFALPHGEVKWSQTIKGLVETSTNLATIKIQNSKIRIGTSQRSSLESELTHIVLRVQSVFQLAGAEYKSSDGYPGWEPNVDSEILRLSRKIYEELFQQEPEVKAIHAGLECGLFLKKHPALDMISIGPTIKGAHTPEERLDIKSTLDFWNFLVRILERMEA